MDEVVGRHAGQRQGSVRMSADAGTLPECKVNTLMTTDHTAFLVHSSG